MYRKLVGMEEDMVRAILRYCYCLLQEQLRKTVKENLVRMTETHLRDLHISQML
jgi:hypothetical protein